MKKWLLIFCLFVFKTSFSQVSISVARSQSGCNSLGIVGVSFNTLSLTANKLYLAVVFSDSSDSYGTLSGTSETWTAIAQAGNFSRKIGVYRCMPTSSTSGNTLTIGFAFGHYPNGVLFKLYEITTTTAAQGANGANAIVQVVIDSATGANPTITMAALRNSNGVVALFSNSIDPFGGTPESGWTEDFDSGCTSAATSSYINGYYGMDRVNGSDKTPTVTASSSTWLGVAIEIKGGRIITVIN